jgi:hypothetical protein
MTTISLKDLYRFPGFRPLSRLLPHPQDIQGYVLKLQRRQKKRYVHVAANQSMDFGLVASIGFGILMQVKPTFILNLIIVGWPARAVTL